MRHEPFIARRLWLSLTLAALLATLFAACGDDDEGASGDGGIVISDVWARPALLLDDGHDMDDMDHDGATAEEMDHEDMDMGGTNGAVYMTIANDGAEDDRLLAVSAEIANAVELHTVNMVEGVMQMRPVEGGIVVPAGGAETVLLEPGGMHVMLVGLAQALEAGDTFELELEFEAAGNVTVEVEVREP